MLLPAEGASAFGLFFVLCVTLVFDFCAAVTRAICGATAGPLHHVLATGAPLKNVCEWLEPCPAKCFHFEDVTNASTMEITPTGNAAHTKCRFGNEDLLLLLILKSMSADVVSNMPR